MVCPDVSMSPSPLVPFVLIALYTVDISLFYFSMMLSGGTDGLLPHFIVVHGRKVGEDDAHDHHKVPDLMTVSADVVLPWIVPLRAPTSTIAYLTVKMYSPIM